MPNRLPRKTAAQPTITGPRATIIILNIPKELAPTLAACCSHWKQTTEKYTLDALLSALDCDVEIVHATAKSNIKKLRDA